LKRRVKNFKHINIIKIASLKPHLKYVPSEHNIIRIFMFKGRVEGGINVIPRSLINAVLSCMHVNNHCSYNVQLLLCLSNNSHHIKGMEIKLHTFSLLTRDH
jgi:hypothetical protein